MSYKSTASVSGFSFISVLAIFLMAGVSLTAYAHHNPGHTGGPGGGDDGGGGTAGTTVVTSVIVDYSLGQVRITGTDLSPATVTIKGDSVTPSTDTATNVVIDFDATTAGIVTETGNYALDINGVSSLVYFSEPLYDPAVPASCPCETVWNTYLSNDLNDVPQGYNGLGTSCTYLSPSGDEAVAYINEIDPVLYIPLHWIMYSRYTSDFKQCAQYLDAVPQPLASQAEHNACVDYLNTNHFAGFPGVTPCEYPADLPVPLPWP